MPRAIEDSLDNVPEELKTYYVEKNGKFEFSGIEGLRTQGDVDRVQEALRKERNDHGGLKEKLRLFEGIDLEEARSKLDRFSELEAIAAGKGAPTEEQVQKLLEAKLNSKLAPIEREKNTLAQQLQEAKALLDGYSAKERQRSIRDSVIAVVTGVDSKIKLNSHAVEDALMFAERMLDVDDDGVVRVRDGVGITPGVSAEVWLQEMLQKKPHWALTDGGGASGSGGSRGNNGTNPWSKDGWNLTEQGRIMQQDPKKAEQMARSAGTTIGAPRKY